MTSPPERRGALFHAKHAFMPNELGYCGPDAQGAILDHLHDSTVTPQLLKKLREFEAAYPYVELIGRSTGRDTFDYSVPEAYWIGNGLLDRVTTREFYSFSHTRLPHRDQAEVRRLFAEAGPGARPHHTFHVLSTFATSAVSDGPSLANGGKRKIEEAVDSCRISWGRVKRVVGRSLEVSRRPVRLGEGGFSLRGPVVTRVGYDGEIAPFGKVRPGDWVSLHWGFACDVITPRQVRNAERFTEADLASVNRVLKATRRG